MRRFKPISIALSHQWLPHGATRRVTSLVIVILVFSAVHIAQVSVFPLNDAEAKEKFDYIQEENRLFVSWNTTKSLLGSRGAAIKLPILDGSIYSRRARGISERKLDGHISALLSTPGVFALSWTSFGWPCRLFIIITPYGRGVGRWSDIQGVIIGNINSAFLGAITMVFIWTGVWIFIDAALFKLVVRDRKRAKKCTICGYRVDKCIGAVCPECGM